jgi:hypothetical protein
MIHLRKRICYYVVGFCFLFEKNLRKSKVQNQNTHISPIESSMVMKKYFRIIWTEFRHLRVLSESTENSLIFDITK